MKRLFLLIVPLLFVLFYSVGRVQAADTNYVTPVFPVRDRAYWRQGNNLTNFTALKKIVAVSGLPATWLVQYDVLFDRGITDSLSPYSSPSAEIGLFLEVTRRLADDSYVPYNWQKLPWSAANKLFLSGYTKAERQQLIDRAFSAFKDKFGYYPATYGAWYVDVWSMEYIRDKYQAKTVLGLADQYSTDGYQTWGQYLDLPYIVSKYNALEPATNTANSTGIVKLQWAPREPLLGYGLSVASSNYSAQVNDYVRGKNMGTEYFSKLLENIVLNVPGKISQAVIGIEAGELEEKYYPDLESQLRIIANLQQQGKIKVTTAGDFGRSYLRDYPYISPPGILGSDSGGKSLWWYFNPEYRVGISAENNHLYISDLRFYHTSSYRDDDQIISDPRQNLVRLVPAVIDAVTLGNKLDLGEAGDIKVVRSDISLTVSWPGGTITASPSGLLLPVSLKSELDKRQISYTETEGGLLLKNPGTSGVKKDFCHDEYGNFAGRFPCIKKIITGFSGWLPDMVYSKIEGQSLLGFRTGYGTFWGLRFPGFHLGKISFPFPVLENFISLKKKLTPVFTWQGSEEYEMEKYRQLGSVYEKGKIYGQDEINMPHPGKMIYENSYYAVYSGP